MLKDTSPRLSELFGEFARIGLFTFGGGYAMIPLIEELCLTRKKWLNAEEMAHTIAISEATPGPIAINCATFVGYKQRSWVGAVATTTGICLPSFVIIYLIAVFISNFLELTVVAHAIQGIKIAVGILICQAGFKMARRSAHSWIGYLVLGLSMLALLTCEWFQLHISVGYILLGSVVFSQIGNALHRSADTPKRNGQSSDTSQVTPK